MYMYIVVVGINLVWRVLLEINPEYYNLLVYWRPIFYNCSNSY